MTVTSLPNRSPQRGQTLVIMALAITALLAALALVIDGGNAYAQQRRTQNGVDAAAEAGATQLARLFAGVAISDVDVAAAVTATATANDITKLDSAEYTDSAGTVLGSVGGGSIPGDAQGVKVGGSREFDTYIAGVVGMPTWTASANATAITGYAVRSGYGGVIPLTIPILLTQCKSGGGSDKLSFPESSPPIGPPGMPWPTGPNNRIAIPLCSNGPGNVGWIDWDGGGGGVPQLGRWITGVDKNPPITTPRWYEVTETGGKTALDAPMDTLEGTDITIPIFYAQDDEPGTPADERLIGTCDAPPANPRDALSDCAPGDVGANGQGWYFLVTFATFHLEHSYIQQNHEAECNDPALASPASPTGPGNKVNNCLIGYFKEDVVAKNMTVGSTTPFNEFTPLAIQLIR